MDAALDEDAPQGNRRTAKFRCVFQRRRRIGRSLTLRSVTQSQWRARWFPIVPQRNDCGAGVRSREFTLAELSPSHQLSRLRSIGSLIRRAAGIDSWGRSPAQNGRARRRRRRTAAVGCRRRAERSRCFGWRDDRCVAAELRRRKCKAGVCRGEDRSRARGGHAAPPLRRVEESLVFGSANAIDAVCPR
jgi:hypothetical protein